MTRMADIATFIRTCSTMGSEQIMRELATRWPDMTEDEFDLACMAMMERRSSLDRRFEE